MKIIYITGQIIQHGGIEKVLAMKLNYLAEAGHEVFLSTYEQGGHPFIYPVSSKVTYEDIQIDYNVDYTRSSLYSWKYLRLVPKHMYRTYCLIRRIQPDVIVIPNFGYEYWFLPFVKGRASIIREFHDSQYNRAMGGLKIKVDDFVQRFYHRIVVLTPQEVAYFNYQRNIAVIPNPIVETSHCSDLSSSVIMTVGRINRVKRFELFIEVARQVILVHPEAVFEIYGEGDAAYQRELQQLIDEKKLGDHVFFKGSTSQVDKVLSQGAIYVCTSRTESFGMTLIEAMESGLPVVSFDCPHGPRNIIEEGVDGFLVSDDSVDRMSQLVCTLLSDRKLLLSMGKKARQKAASFHIDHIMKKWLNLFYNK